MGSATTPLDCRHGDFCVAGGSSFIYRDRLITKTPTPIFFADGLCKRIGNKPAGNEDSGAESAAGS